MSISTVAGPIALNGGQMIVFTKSDEKIISTMNGRGFLQKTEVDDVFKQISPLSPDKFPALNQRSVEEVQMVRCVRLLLPEEENETIFLDDILSGKSKEVAPWSDDYIKFIQEQIMEPSAQPCVAALIDESQTFVAYCHLFENTMTQERAREYGMILPSTINEWQSVRPLFIRCFGVTSGDTSEQILEAARVLLSLKPKTLDIADGLVLEAIERIQQENQDDMVCVVPFIIGHSLGGMFGNSIAVKNHIGSMCFNQLGLGSGALDWVGHENWECARQEDMCRHVSMSVEYDFVSSELSILRQMVITPGLRVSVDNMFEGVDPVRTHCNYEENFKLAVDNIRDREQHNEGVESTWSFFNCTLL